MARRKNSAEMLDILRRISHDSRSKGPAPAGKAPPHGTPGAAGSTPPARPPASSSGRWYESGGGSIPSLFESAPRFAGNERSEPAVGEEEPGASRRTIFSVLRMGGRSPTSSWAEEGDREASSSEARAAGEEAIPGSALPGSRASRTVFQLEGIGLFAPQGGAAIGQAPLGAPPEILDEVPPAVIRDRPPGPSPKPAPRLPDRPADPESRDDPPGDHTQPGDPMEGMQGSAPAAADPPRKLLFGVPASEESLFARALRIFWTEGLRPRFNGRVPSRSPLPVVTIALYVAVAVAAMLLMAFILNLDSLRRDERASQFSDDPIAPAPAGDIALSGIEVIPPAPEALPEVRNQEGTAAPAKEDTPADEGLTVYRTASAPKGHYLIVQSFTDEDEGQIIIDHLTTLGYRHFWLKPRKQEPKYRDLLLGPYTSLDLVEKEKVRFKKLLAKSPVEKRPNLNFTGAYPYSNK